MIRNTADQMSKGAPSWPLAPKSNTSNSISFPGLCTTSRVWVFPGAEVMVKGLPGGLGAPVLLLSSRQRGPGISLGLVVPLVLSALPLENTGMDILNTVAGNITLAFPCCRSLAVFPAIPNNIWVFCLQPTKLRAALQVVPRALGFSELLFVWHSPASLLTPG